MATTSTPSTTLAPHQRQSIRLTPAASSASSSSLLSAFDLTKVGLGGTLSVCIFLVVGYIARSIAGPSVILSVIIAASIAFLAGTFYAELNCTLVMSLWRSVQLKTPSPSIASTATIPSISAAVSPPSGAINIDDASTGYQCAPAALSSKLLMPSFIFTYLCMGEFAAFVVGWNLLLEQVIGVALAAKGIAAYVDMLIFDRAGVNMTPLQPDASNISDYFDFFAFFIPILVGGPLVLIVRRSTVLSTLSVVSSIAVVIFILILGITNADVSNWTAAPPTNSTGRLGNGGFFPFGMSGMFQGAALILFTFIGFDSMAYYPLNWYTSKAQQIAEFQKTVTTSILSINGILFISLIGATVALTSTWPYYLLKENLPLPNVFASVGWSGTTFIVLIAGIIALFGSLFAFMHAILRTIQAMAFDGPRAFKLFAKFEQNHLLREIQLQQAKQQQQQQHHHQTSSTPQRHSDEIDMQPQYHNHRQQQLPILGCLLFALLAGLMAALFELDQLMNLLSIGALLMFYTLTMDIILLRYSPNSKKIFSQSECVAFESEAHASDAPKRSISLIAILLTIYCILCKLLVVLIKLVEYDALRLPVEWSIGILVVFIIVMVLILFIMGLQPKRNSMFELKLSVNPVFPAANIFACIYLMSELNVVTWIRYVIWMLIGIALYIIILKVNHQRRRSFERNANNNVFMSDHNHTNTTVTEMEETTGPVEALKPLEDDDASQINRRSTTPDVIPKMVEIGRQTIESIESPVAMQATMQAESLNLAYMIEEEAVATSAAIDVDNQLTRKSNESQCNGFDDIEFADDVKMCCIEKREPNGKVYFIEMDLTHGLGDASPQTTTAAASFGGEAIIKEMVDKVLYQADRGDQKHETIAVDRKTSPPGSENDVVSEDESEAPEDAEIETRAIVHAINDVKELEMAAPAVAATETEPIPLTDKKPFFTFGVYQSPSNSRMERSPPESIGRSKEFKDRLARLLGQFSEEPMKYSTSLERKRSISIPDNLNTASMTADRRPSLKLLVNGASSSEIPVPLKFDKLMYDTIGRQMKKQYNQIQVPVTAMSIENEFAKSFNRLASPSSRMHRTKKSDDLMKLFDHETEAYAETASVASIKERLNEIYGRRPPGATFIEEHVNSELADSRRSTEEGIQLRKPIKPFDTVHKQKQLFGDVLKSINPDVRNSLHRTESIESADVNVAMHRD